MSQVTVAELDTLIEQLAVKEDECDAQSEVTTKLNKEYNALLYRIAAYCKDLGREDYTSPVGTFKTEMKWRVNMPQSDADKRVLFEHLKERGIFDKYASVHAQSLNALYRQDWEAAKERGEGMTFAMPGVPAPIFEPKPSFKKAKKK